MRRDKPYLSNSLLVYFAIISYGEVFMIIGPTLFLGTAGRQEPRSCWDTCPFVCSCSPAKEDY